jgi:hypothetical protein
LGCLVCSGRAEQSRSKQTHIFGLLLLLLFGRRCLLGLVLGGLLLLAPLLRGVLGSRRVGLGLVLLGVGPASERGADQSSMAEGGGLAESSIEGGVIGSEKRRRRGG